MDGRAAMCGDTGGCDVRMVVEKGENVLSVVVLEDISKDVVYHAVTN